MNVHQARADVFYESSTTSIASAWERIESVTTNTHTDCETHLSVCLFELLGTSSVFGEQCVQRCLCHRTTGCLGRVCRRFELRRSRGVLGKFCVQRGLLWVRLCSRGLCFCRRLQQRIKVRSVSLCWSAGVTHSCRAGCCIARGRALPSRLLRDLVVVVNPVRGLIHSRFPPAKGALRTRAGWQHGVAAHPAGSGSGAPSSS